MICQFINSSVHFSIHNLLVHQSTSTIYQVVNLLTYQFTVLYQNFKLSICQFINSNFASGLCGTFSCKNDLSGFENGTILVMVCLVLRALQFLQSYQRLLYGFLLFSTVYPFPLWWPLSILELYLKLIGFTNFI